MFRQDTDESVREALHALEYLAVVYDTFVANKPLNAGQTLLVAQARFLWHLEHDAPQRQPKKASRKRGTTSPLTLGEPGGSDE